MTTAELLLRLIAALAILFCGAALYAWANRVILRRARSRSLGLASARPGVPAIVYFTTPTCAPCKTVQRPAIERLQQYLGDCLQVIEIDAAARPDLASQWGVLSVPTTFILDEKGTPRHVNHGVALAGKLLKQLESLNEKPTFQHVSHPL